MIDFDKKVKEACSVYNGDVIVYIGGISRQGYSWLSDLLEARTKKKGKLCLILATLGGDPNAAFRIARAIRHHYKHFDVMIPDLCKSAGTLVCIGADQLIFGDRGELGPLDVQLSKPDEMFENTSGLNLIQAIAALQTQTIDAFGYYLLNIRSTCGVSTKTAAEMASRLAEGFISPIVAKIDPLTLGEHERALQIAVHYGKLLAEMSQTVDENALGKLTSSYPSHSFVIDRKEAASIFSKVKAPDQKTITLYHISREILQKVTLSPDHPFVLDLGSQLSDSEPSTTEYNDSNNPDTTGTDQIDQEINNSPTDPSSTGGEKEAT